MVGVSSSNPYSSMGAQRRLDNSGARTFEQLRNEVGGGAGGSGGDGAGSATVNPMGYAPAATMPGTQGAGRRAWRAPPPSHGCMAWIV